MHQTDRHYVHELDGMGYKMPAVFGVFTVSALALMGVPGLAGFVSKWNIVQSLLDGGNIIGYVGVIVLLYSALMTGIYMMTIVVRAWFPHVGYHKDQVEPFKDPSWLMKLPLVIFSIVTIVIGVYAQPMLDFIQKIATGAL